MKHVNRLFLLLYSMLFCVLVSCNGAGKSNGLVKAVEKADSCKLDAKNTYEVFIPARIKATDKLPLLVIIDAHGSGRFALDKFKQGANRYKAVLIASNLVKNGFEGYEGALQTLIEDVRLKYPVNGIVFMAGFSGGARMALGYGLIHPLDGLIMCGALANPDQLNAVHCPVISIAGMDDFNFMETAQYLFHEQQAPANLKIELTNSSHSWPDSLMLANALGFLRFSCKTGDIPTPAKSQITLYCCQQQERINSLKQQGDFLKAALVARNMALTEPFGRESVFASTYQTLKTTPGYIDQLSRLQQCLAYETNMRQPYVDDFQTKDVLWWKNEISTTENKIKTEQDSFTKDMYRRIKGFWGIACYSLCKQAISQQNTDALDKILSIYRLLEPENPDMLYFSAFPSYWAGNNDTTLKLLQKALKAGFSDRNQLKKDFTESISSRL